MEFNVLFNLENPKSAIPNPQSSSSITPACRANVMPRMTKGEVVTRCHLCHIKPKGQLENSRTTLNERLLWEPVAPLSIAGMDVYHKRGKDFISTRSALRVYFKHKFDLAQPIGLFYPIRLTCLNDHRPF